jgi:hypothetical protein
MFIRKIVTATLGTLALAGGLAFAPAASANSHVGFSVSIGAPGFGVAVGNAPYYGAYRPYYGHPYYRHYYYGRPVYAPVYVAPPVVYSQPAYPAPYYSAPYYSAPPSYSAPSYSTPPADYYDYGSDR